jgi:rod shape determining protein RodA
VIGEEYGFAGAALVLSLFALLIWRVPTDTHHGEEPLRRADSRGIVAMLFPGLRQRRHDDRIMPITGVPLPL